MTNGTYHGVLPISSLQLRISSSVAAATGGVNTAVINTNSHHFALLWVVAARRRAAGRAGAGSGSRTCTGYTRAKLSRAFTLAMVLGLNSLDLQAP